MKNNILGKRDFLAGFTLIELLVVMVIVGIILTFALPQFAATKEHLLDKEAKSTLALIRAAEKIYKMEYQAYYPSDLAGNPTGPTEDVAEMNVRLKLSLPVSSNSPWIHKVDSIERTATSTRRGAGGRKWTVNLFDESDPSLIP